MRMTPSNLTLEWSVEKPEQAENRNDQQAEKEICWIQDDSLIDKYKNVDRHSPRSIANICHVTFSTPLLVYFWLEIYF